MSAQLLTRTLPVTTVRAIRQEGETEGAETVFEFVASTENPVRVYDYERWEVIREVLRVDGADLADYERNPVVLDAHRKGGSEHIAGKSVELRREPGRLIARIEFDDEPGSTGARNLRLVRKGMLRALSVGYLPGPGTEIGFDEETGERIVERNSWSLIEISTAPIPADPDALKRSHEASMKNKPSAKRPAKRAAEEGESASEEEDEEGERTEAMEGDAGSEEGDAVARADEEGEEAEADDADADADEPTLEEEEEAARTVAAQLTHDPARQGELVRMALEQDSPMAWTRKLEAKLERLYKLTKDESLRKVGGELIAERVEKLDELDLRSELRKVLAERTKSVGTPEPPKRPAKKPAAKQGEGERSTHTNNPPAGSPLLGLLRS